MNLLESFRRRKDLLKLINVLKIGPTYGANTIAVSTDVFAEIDIAFTNHCDRGEVTPETFLLAYELRRDATFREMFEWLAKSRNKDINDFCITQNQISDLANKCPHWIIDPNKATIMLFKSKGQFCIAVMSVKKEEKFRINFFILDYPIPWLGEFHHLVIIPKCCE